MKNENNHNNLIINKFLFLTILVAIFSLFLLYPGIGGGFIFDDIPNIVENSSLHIASLNINDMLYAAYSFEPGQSSRPLAMLSFALDYWRGGLEAINFKVTNLVIHGLTVIALAYFFRLLLTLANWTSTNSARGAIVLALLWAIHPLQVSSVLYVVQRMQTMGTLFLVLALLSYLKMRQAQIQNKRSRHFGILTLLIWLVAFSCKEDSVLLPAYTLGLELFILKFQANNNNIANIWKNLYKWLTIIGVAIFLLVIIPHYWQSDYYATRDFSSSERLLTQGRVVSMYLKQILLPLPSSMPFYYDDLIISRSFWQPLTTFPALLLLSSLLAAAWYWHKSRPLFALGVYLFFAGHFMTSNVINLELAFEHRNHFPLIGAILAIVDLCAAAFRHWAIRPKVATILIVSISICMGAGTVTRAYTWGDPLRFAQNSVEAAPNSARAWLTLCTYYFKISNQEKDNQYLDIAIETCQEGAEKTKSAPLMSNVVIFKTIKGTINQSDWNILLDRLQQAPMNSQNKGIIWTTLNNLDRKIPLDENGVLRTIEIISARTTFSSGEYLRLAAYIFNETHQPQKAFAYLQRAVEFSVANDPAIVKTLSELSEAGREDWAEELSLLMHKNEAFTE